MRIVDIWGISSEELSRLPEAELILDNLSWQCTSVMYQVKQQHNILEHLAALGASDYDAVS
jgi:hypothetical protein